MSDVEQPGTVGAVLRALELRPEIEAALSSQGPNGERARNLLQTAALILSEPERFPAAREVVQACCRSALDSIFKLANHDVQGVRAAETRVIAGAETVVDAMRAGSSAFTESLESLGAAVDALLREKSDPGGYRRGGDQAAIGSVIVACR